MLSLLFQAIHAANCLRNTFRSISTVLLKVCIFNGFGIHSGCLRAVGLSEVAAGGFLFVGDPLMGPAIGAVLTLSRWIRQVVLRGHLPADR